MSPFVFLLLFLLPLATAARSVMVRASRAKVHPYAMTTVFFSVAAPFIWLYWAISGAPSFDGHIWIGAAMGVLGSATMVFGWLLTNSAISAGGLSSISPFVNLTVLFLAILEPIVFRSDYAPSLFLSLPLMAAGSWFIARGARKKTAHAEELKPILIIIFAAFLLALYGLSAKIALTSGVPRTLFAAVIATGASFILLAMSSAGMASASPIREIVRSARENPKLMLSAGFATAIIMFIEAFLYSVSALPAALVIVAKRMSIALEMGAGKALFGEVLTPHKVIGAILLLLGGAISLFA